MLSFEAGKQWGGTYAATPPQMINDIWSKDIDTSAMLPNGGSNFGNGMQTNPSYLGACVLPGFATVDSGHAWGTVATNTYTALNTIAGKSTGTRRERWFRLGAVARTAEALLAAATRTAGSTSTMLTAFRGGSAWTPAGMAATTPFLAKNAGFFSGIAADGVGRIVDIYTLSGTPNSDAAPNSMSIVGTAGVGAMAAGSSFANTAWQFLLDASYSPASQIKDTMGHIGYTYYNATVGLITALTLSGNFNNF